MVVEVGGHGWEPSACHDDYASSDIEVATWQDEHGTEMTTFDGHDLAHHRLLNPAPPPHRPTPAAPSQTRIWPNPRHHAPQTRHSIHADTRPTARHARPRTNAKKHALAAYINAAPRGPLPDIPIRRAVAGPHFTKPQAPVPNFSRKHGDHHAGPGSPKAMGAAGTIASPEQTTTTAGIQYRNVRAAPSYALAQFSPALLSHAYTHSDPHAALAATSFDETPVLAQGHRRSISDSEAHLYPASQAQSSRRTSRTVTYKPWPDPDLPWRRSLEEQSRTSRHVKGLHATTAPAAPAGTDGSSQRAHRRSAEQPLKKSWLGRGHAHSKSDSHAGLHASKPNAALFQDEPHVQHGSQVRGHQRNSAFHSLNSARLASTSARDEVESYVREEPPDSLRGGDGEQYGAEPYDLEQHDAQALWTPLEEQQRAGEQRYDEQQYNQQQNGQQFSKQHLNEQQEHHGISHYSMLWHGLDEHNSQDYNLHQFGDIDGFEMRALLTNARSGMGTNSKTTCHRQANHETRASAIAPRSNVLTMHSANIDNGMAIGSANLGNDNAASHDLHQTRSNTHNHASTDKSDRTHPKDEGDAQALEVFWRGGDDDPENPRAMSRARKWLIVVVLSWTSFCVTCTSSMYTFTYGQLTSEFGCSRLIATLGLSTFIFGLGLGPMLFSPFSEFYGRRPIYLASLFCFIIWLIPCAVAQNIETMIVVRFFSGFAGSAFLSVAGGTVGDMFNKKQLQAPMLIYTSSPFMGPAIGPVLSGFINQYTDWRWTFYTIIIWSFVIFCLVALLVPETYHPVLLRKRAVKLRRKTGDERWQAPIERMNKSIPKTLATSILRPMQLLFLEPMCFNLCLFSALLLGIIYLFFGAFILVFEGHHGFTLSQTGLTFLGLFAGMVIACSLDPLFHRNYLKLLARHEKETGAVGGSEPEYRLPPAVVGAILVPIGLFWFGWTTYASVHWIVPIVGSAVFGMGTILVYSGVFTFLVDAYPLYAASALAANSLARSTFAAVFPLFGVQMYRKLGDQWATTLLACLTLVMAPFPWIFYKYGKRIRGTSRFAK